ncbi:MAG TPA: glycoside hydrolase family 2 TIM barrel-domain containing protein, partial [Pontiella sp.]|nr:glycoside hydrolase family 2 TIM barrel-domain containing protein [Pontiella sp.]
MTHQKLSLFFIGTIFALPIVQAADGRQSDTAGPSVVEIQKAGDRFELLRNGKPYFINGAGGNNHLDMLVANGGNSIRTWSSSRAVLDQAWENGLTVCMGIRMRKPRHGADYSDTKMLEEQRERICNEVIKLKDHPALLMWGIGNEVEHHASPEEARLVWQEIEHIARRIKMFDENHPVITVIAGAGRKLADIQELCPSLDAIGINSYGKLAEVPSAVQQYNWKKPYIITEFGPRGYWEVEKTDWGLPIEDTSTEKARVYREGYLAAIDDKPNCLGSYVFLWGNKQEKTHTWFNLFLEDGTPTEIVDTMWFLWTGAWPENRAPTIGTKKIYSVKNKSRDRFAASSEVTFKVEAADPDGDALTIEWDIRKDESDNPSTGGDWEPRIPPIDDAIISSESDAAVIRMPAEEGNYRIFVYVYDPSGKVATA